MLRRKTFARLASDHSPEKEQRLLSFADKKKVDKHGNPLSLESGEVTEQTNPTIEQIRLDTHQRIALLTDLAKIRSRKEEEELQEKFFREHGEYLAKKYPTLAKDEQHRSATLSFLTTEFKEELDTIVQRLLEDMGPMFDFRMGKYFREKYLETLEQSGIPTADNLRIPPAFRAGDTIYIDAAHPDFDARALKQSHPGMSDEEVQRLRKRNVDQALLHEIVHYETKRKKRGDIFLRSFLHDIESLPTWRRVREAIDQVFKGTMLDTTDETYAKEALSIYFTGKHIGFEQDDSQQEVFQAMSTLLTELPNQQKEAVQSLATDIDKSTQSPEELQYEGPLAFGRRHFEHAMAGRADNMIFAEGMRQTETEWSVETRPPAGSAEAQEELRMEALKNFDSQKDSKDEEELLKKIDEIMQNERDLDEKGKRLAEGLTNPEEKKRAEAAVVQIKKLLSDAHLTLIGFKEKVDILHRWKDPTKITAAEQNDFATEHKLPGAGSYIDNMPLPDRTLLDDSNKAEREDIFSRIDEAIKVYYAPLDDMKDFLEMKEGRDAMAKRSAENEMYHAGGITGWMRRNVTGPQSGISWVCFYDLIKIWNIYSEAFKDKWTGMQKVRVYGIARRINLIPALQPDLDRQARAANEEETSKFKEFLEKDKVGYEALFVKPNNVMQRNIHDPNRAKAVLEYAAEHAWLYRMDRFHGDNVYGFDYEGNFGGRAFEELVEHNAASQDKEKGKGRSRVDTHPDIHMVIEDIEHELEKRNLWAVLGMVERVQEKGKYSESNAWALVTIIRKLREDAGLRRVMEKGLLDQIGGIGIGQSAWTLTAFKMQRHQMMDWIKEGCTDEAAAHQSKDLVWNSIIEAENLLSAHPENEKKSGKNGLDRKVAQILAAQTVRSRKDGSEISIFQNNEAFNEYRKYWNTSPTSTEPGKTDDDFFNPGNGGSDVLLLGKTAIQAILVRTSQGQWTHQTKAPYFMAQIFMRDEELKRKNPGARREFQAAMKEKLSYFFKEAVAQDATRKKFGTDTTPSMSGKAAGVSDKNILLQLWKRDLISREPFIAFVRSIPDESLKSTEDPIPEIVALIKKKEIADKEKAEKEKRDREEAERQATGNANATPPPPAPDFAQELENLLERAKQN